MELNESESGKLEFSIRTIEDPDVIFSLLHYGTNLPVSESLRRYIVNEITRMDFKSIVLYDHLGNVAGHTCYYFWDRILYFVFFGVPDEDPRLTEKLVDELVFIGKAQNVEAIRGPINLPHVIYGWGFAEEGSSQEPFVAADYTNPEYITHFKNAGFEVHHRILRFDVPLYPLKFTPTWDIRFGDLSPEGREEWKDDFIDLQVRLFPASTQVTPNVIPFFDDCMDFVSEFGPDNLIVFTYDQEKPIGLGWGTPNCFDMSEETGVCKSILLFGGSIEPEYQRKGVLKQMIGLFAYQNAKNGITHGEMPIGEDNPGSIYMA